MTIYSLAIPSHKITRPHLACALTCRKGVMSAGCFTGAGCNDRLVPLFSVLCFPGKSEVILDAELL